MPDRVPPPVATPARPRRRAARGSGSAGPPPFARVVEEHGPAVLRFCAAQVGPERAEDVFQETMLSALQAYGQVRDAPAVRAWLFAIAARKAVDFRRARGRAPEPVADPQPASTSAAADGGLVDAAVWESVRALPAKQRQAVTLRFLGDLSHREIAHVMQTSEAAARRNLFEALERLRRYAQPAAGPPGGPAGARRATAGGSARGAPQRR